MSEHHPGQFRAENDETARISREVIDDTQDRLASRLVEGESRTLLPPQEGREERTKFRMTEHALYDGREPIAFETHVNEEGNWVVETPMFEGEQWVLPPDTEYTIGRAGMYVRKKKDVQNGVPPIGPLPLPQGASPILQMMMQQARDTGQGFPALVFMAHESATGQGNLLSLANRGDGPVTTEIIGTTLALAESHDESAAPEEDMPQDTRVVDELVGDTERDAVENVAGSAVPEIAPESEDTQEVAVSDILDEAREGIVAEETQGDAEVVQLTDMAETLAENVENATEEASSELENQDSEDAQEDSWESEGGALPSGSQAIDREVKPKVPERFRVAVALGSMPLEEALAREAEEQLAAENAAAEEGEIKASERLILEGLTVPEAINKTIDHVSSRFDVIIRTTDGAIQEFDIAHRKFFRAGNIVNDSGILVALEDMKRRFGEHQASFEDTAKSIEAYIRDEEEAYVSTEEEISEERQLRRQALDKMEELRGKVVDMRGANSELLEVQRSLYEGLQQVASLRYYPDDRRFDSVIEQLPDTGKRELVGMSDLVQHLNERTTLGRAARNVMQELEELQQKLQPKE